MTTANKNKYSKGTHILERKFRHLFKGTSKNKGGNCRLFLCPLFLDVNVVVIGDITESIHSKHFIATGRYKLDNLPSIIKEHDIDTFLVPFIYPETFSYTTQEIMMELPLMVFDLGAPAERVRKYDKGVYN